MAQSKIGAARADVARLRVALRGVIDAVQPVKSEPARKEIAYAEVVLKETDHAD
jgi:hypothetical protein